MDFNDFATQRIAYAHWNQRGRPAGDDWTDWYWAEHVLHVSSNEETAILLADNPQLWCYIPPIHGLNSSPLAGVDPRDFFTFIQAKEWVEEFERILDSLKITIEKGSVLEGIWLEVAEMEGRRQGTSPIDTKQDIRDMQRRVLGLLDIVRRVIRVHSLGRLSPLVSHLKLLSQCDFAQNVRTEGGFGRDKQVAQDRANKVFELLIGLVISELASDVATESPGGKKKRDDNPDVLATIHGKRWGFACKVLSSISPRAMVANLEKGCEQLKRAQVEKGLVIFNLKNVIAHDRFWNVLGIDDTGEQVYSALSDKSVAVGQLDAFVDSLGKSIREELTEDDITSVFDNEALIPLIMIFSQTAFVLAKNGGTILVTLGRTSLISIEDILATDDMAVIMQMNEVFQHRPPKTK